jgi:2-polyprenyl-3-methyl-5-hydroxy-6-metoxy-1,4-benzoquinol methylase
LASGSQSKTTYLLGHTERERERLKKQAAILRACTERLFRAAGIAPGMRVLDLGCGMGDVAMLAAELVGPSGCVVAIDRDLAALEQARERVAREELSAPIRFEHTAIEAFHAAEPFDAAVGRYVLLYQPDPAATLRHLAAQLRAGGILAFHEVDFSDVGRSWPEAPLWAQTANLIIEVYRRGGIPPDLGKRLARTFLDADLPRPAIQMEAAVGGEAGSLLYGWITETLRSLLPRIEQFGLANVEELATDTRAERMEAEAVAVGAQFLGPAQYLAWTRKA